MYAFFFQTAGSVAEHLIDAPVFAVQFKERGFYPIYTHASPEQLNGGTPAEVLDAALAASMFGWNTQIAKKVTDWVNDQEQP